MHAWWHSYYFRKAHSSLMTGTDFRSVVHKAGSYTTEPQFADEIHVYKQVLVLC